MIFDYEALEARGVKYAIRIPMLFQQVNAIKRELTWTWLNLQPLRRSPTCKGSSTPRMPMSWRQR